MRTRKALRRFGTTSLVAAIGLVLAGCGGGASGSGDSTLSWRLAETHPRDYPTTQADIWFADQLRERSNGRIDVTVYPDAQLGEERDVLEQMQLGSVEMNRTNANLVGEFVPSWTAFGLPYIFDSSEHFWAFLQGEGGRQKLDELKQAGMKGLAYYDSGARSLYNVGQPIKRPEDLAGKNMRVQPGSITAEVIEAMGGSATTMSFSEVYSGLETGVIDGAENNLPSYVSTRHYEVAENITLDEHQRVPEVLMISQTVWNQLTEEDKQLVQTVASESTEVQRELWAQEVEESRAELTKAGVTITEVPDKQPFKDAVAELNSDYQQQYGPFLDAVDAARP
ncbi:tripartite ATP-independent transporter solute receptor, DctP family [Amycolatopsis marina]|uniref:Tripartite ATP-independent transporter solute receptor, DctP family n=1 Tax=Amycolatopsis marina TaxID=490629 RepID=A0A1I1BTI8_9PSEU|nr:TRAP transporter substrate-binding protein [Amycolatopsis marina]SFB53006.1 tripartite ATP-independent transporter solute receptor, DctP family [Amycolatopsis marina]